MKTIFGILLLVVAGVASAQATAMPDPNDNSPVGVYVFQLEGSVTVCTPVAIAHPVVTSYSALTDEQIAAAATCADNLAPSVQDAYKKALAALPALKPEILKCYSAWLSVMQVIRNPNYDASAFAEWRLRHDALQSADNDLRAAAAAQ